MLRVLEARVSRLAAWCWPVITMVLAIYAMKRYTELQTSGLDRPALAFTITLLGLSLLIVLLWRRIYVHCRDTPTRNDDIVLAICTPAVLFWVYYMVRACFNRGSAHGMLSLIRHLPDRVAAFPLFDQMAQAHPRGIIDMAWLALMVVAALSSAAAMLFRERRPLEVPSLRGVTGSLPLPRIHGPLGILHRRGGSERGPLQPMARPSTGPLSRPDMQQRAPQPSTVRPTVEPGMARPMPMPRPDAGPARPLGMPANVD